MDERSDAVVMVDIAGRIVHWDAGAERLFGYAASDMLGQLVEVIVPDDYRSAHAAGLSRVMSGGERHLVGAAVNLPVRTANGDVLAFPARFHHLDTPSGQPLGALASFSARAGNEQPWTPIS